MGYSFNANQNVKARVVCVSSYRIGCQLKLVHVDRMTACQHDWQEHNFAIQKGALAYIFDSLSLPRRVHQSILNSLPRDKELNWRYIFHMLPQKYRKNVKKIYQELLHCFDCKWKYNSSFHVSGTPGRHQWLQSCPLEDWRFLGFFP